MKHLSMIVLLFTITIASCNKNPIDNLKNTEAKNTINILNQKNIENLEEPNNSKSRIFDLSTTSASTSKPIILQNDSSLFSSYDKYTITENGIGEISLGQKFKPSNFFVEVQGQLEGAENCFFANSGKYTDYQNILSFQVIDNIITGINIFNDDNFQTYTGVKVGDTTATIFEKHGREPDEIIVNPYTEQPVFVYWTDSANDIGVRYDIEEGKVFIMSLNYEPYIRYFEGCG